MAEDGIEWLKEILVDVQLTQFLVPLRDDLLVTRLEHFEFVKPEDLENVGLSKPGMYLGVLSIKRKIGRPDLAGLGKGRPHSHF